MRTIFCPVIKGVFLLLLGWCSLSYAAEPGGVASPKWWGEADSLSGADNSAVATWLNSSSTNSGQNALQGTAVNRPLLRNSIAKRMNFNPVVQFDGSNDSMAVNNGFSGAAIHQRAHYFMVVMPDNSTQQSFTFWETQAVSGGESGRLSVHTPWLNTIYWDAGTCCSNNRLAYIPSSPYVSTPTVWSFVKDTSPPAGMAQQEISRNGQVEATKASTLAFVGNNSDFIVGSGPGSGFFDGDIAEGLLYIDTSINMTARSKIESYLALKYGITLGEPVGAATHYLSSAGTVWWTGTSAYQFNVAGIAKDATSALDQRVSRSSNTGMAQMSIAAGGASLRGLSPPKALQTQSAHWMPWCGGIIMFLRRQRLLFLILHQVRKKAHNSAGAFGGHSARVALLAMSRCVFQIRLPLALGRLPICMQLPMLDLLQV